MRARFLKVLPNPYLHLDDNSEPSAVVAVDPAVNPDNRAFVGAKLSATESLDNYPKHYFLSPRQYNTWEFSKEPVTIEFTAYYRDLIKDQVLIAADETTAKTCGISFADPKKILDEHKATAANQWYAAYGEFPYWYNKPVAAKSQTEVVLKEASKA